MTDLTTSYLGLDLKNPLIASASPLSRQVSDAKRLEDAGASAIVMSSLFEEKIVHEEQHTLRFIHAQSLGYGEADSFHPMPYQLKSYADSYLEHLHMLKSSLEIPVIASLNGTSLGTWVDYGKLCQQAGADAIELNMYYLAANPQEDSATIENRYLSLVSGLTQQVAIPVAVKLSPNFTAPVHFAGQLAAVGASGLVLFNRFYQPDIDLDTLEILPTLKLSSAEEALLRIRWIALLHGQVPLSLSATGGFHKSADVIKALLAGADSIQLCSVLLERGIDYLTQILNEVESWLSTHEYRAVKQLQGSVSYQQAINPSEYERANYIHVLDSYTSPQGVLR